MWILSFKCCGSSFSFHSSFVCGEVGLITGMITLRVVGGKVGVMNHETIIMLLAPKVGGNTVAPTREDCIAC